MKHRWWALIVTIAALLGSTAGATAQQSYPTRPVTILVPFAAGGPSGALARILGERLRGALGQTFVVENVVGAGGSLGVGRAVRSPPDGYTISFGHLGTHVFTGAIYPLQ
jgi:tripartite-type tricarboxylate transporter receptor subunit TctC